MRCSVCGSMNNILLVMPQAEVKLAARSAASISSPGGRGADFCNSTKHSRVFRSCSAFLSACTMAAHCTCFSVHWLSFHSMSWKSTTTDGSTCSCFNIQLRLSMPLG
ncbi:CG32276 [Drosophila busckii]|uniref:CG32276 n=1 Tax=Drosophila busckii TaxID=30019 RepID=A0A0M4EXC4_DROBS|nr:CG32276 [Drosophila busckii]